MGVFPDYVYKFMVGMVIFLLFIVTIISMSGIYQQVSLDNALLIPQIPSEPNLLDYIAHPFNYLVWLVQLSFLDFGIAFVNTIILGAIAIVGMLMLIEIVMVLYPF